MSGDAPKSSFELAMERLRKKDAAEGTAPVALTEAQKAAIAETRRVYEARLAQEEILHQTQARAVVDPAVREEMELQYRRERERLTSEREGKIEKIRRGDS